ncbi:uncharacterized protein LOC104895689 [Beta vulgaris subsp. vulgaris]|uniref:uncharacterized protein LOC104895689 n=1 Tax=Beta vulgaris subsp. vulgaris TaxID=3555 RepID=UPI002546D7EB|nr:uncharacterized protein LOC104895689 [Beta vulgaris subsp. vulgaris]
MGDMDSGNSGSMQSSSTGGGGGEDQEYDSRGGAAVFFNPAAAAISNFNLENMTPPLQLYSFSNNNGSSSFAHHQVSNYFDHPPTLSQSSSLECSNFMLNHHNNGTNNNPNNNNNQLDMVWPNKFASIRPSISTDDANCTHHDGPLSYSITNNQQQQQQQQQPMPVPAQGPPTAPTNAGSSRNPKKRSRASRRAPTTVLTTDTSNFRQMVQEFTGIPAPPFTAFSTRTRFDIFGGLGGHSSSTTVPPPPYLLRPFPQKRTTTLHQPSFLANSSLPSLTTTTTTTSTSNINNSNAALVDGIGLAPSSTTCAANTSVSTTIAPPPTTTAFQLCDPHEFLNTNNNNNNHPQLSFQSLLQPSSVAVTCTTATPHHTTCSVNPAGDALVNGRGTGTNGGATKGEGMVDSWICSSD